MTVLRDAAYLLAALLTWPIWLFDLIRRDKHRADWRARFGHTHLSPTLRPTLLIHAVSVGEVNATRQLIDELTARHRDELRIVVSATTNTGIARARELYETRHEVVRYPWDFSWAVRRFMRQIKPDVVALVELELWPNFSAICKRSGAALLIINGRLSERSHRGYRRFRSLLRGMFGRVDRVLAQDDAYAARFIDLGTPSDRVTTTGTMKWDTAQITDAVPGSDELAQALGIDADRPLIVCGSTGPGEERLFCEHLGKLADADGRPVQLLCAPRKPERFDEAAAAMGNPRRRSAPEQGGDADRFLLDTLGELRAAYALADVVVVGRSFSPLYGSDMMEPAALGKPIVVGPNTADFADTMARLLAGDGIVQVADGPALAQSVEQLLREPRRARELADHARQVIRQSQGATRATADVIDEYLSAQRGKSG